VQARKESTILIEAECSIQDASVRVTSSMTSFSHHATRTKILSCECLIDRHLAVQTLVVSTLVDRPDGAWADPRELGIAADDLDHHISRSADRSLDGVLPGSLSQADGGGHRAEQQSATRISKRESVSITFASEPKFC
jgi:hypothetical protein